MSQNRKSNCNILRKYIMLKDYKMNQTIFMYQHGNSH